MSIRYEFDLAMRRIYDVARKHGYTPTDFIQLVEEHGGVEAAHHLLESPVQQEVTLKLWELGLVDESMEVLVLEKQYRSLFTDAEVEIAKTRLKQLGYKVE